jgi:hypothetical protein
MLKTYKINGKKYQTIKIPKGTVLFRGLSFENKLNYETLFGDIIGARGDSRYYIAPTMNVFFYPVPYVSDVVNIYTVHTLYITQYDIELVMLVSPATISRGNKDILDPQLSPITTCSRISEFDKCGYRMSDTDPCLTDIIIKYFPQIDGFIGLAEQDIQYINRKYKDIASNPKTRDMARQIIPSMITNSRGLSGIPEIVIHPLRFRHEECKIMRAKFRTSEDIVKYCSKHRAQYNYFPLVYFTNNGIFTFNDMKDDKTIELIANSVRVLNSPTTMPKIYENINIVFSAMLNDGYNVNGTMYKILVDRRTGFYRAVIDTEPNRVNSHRITHKKVQREGVGDGFEGYLDAYVIKPTNNSEINSILSKHSKYIDDYLLANLANNGYSLKKTLGFKRKAKRQFMYNYYINKMIERPDLEGYDNLRGKHQKQTRKNINGVFSQTLAFDGFTLGDLEDVSSVESI